MPAYFSSDRSHSLVPLGQKNCLQKRIFKHRNCYIHTGIRCWLSVHCLNLSIHCLKCVQRKHQIQLYPILISIKLSSLFEHTVCPVRANLKNCLPMTWIATEPHKVFAVIERLNKPPDVTNPITSHVPDFVIITE